MKHEAIAAGEKLMTNAEGRSEGHGFEGSATMAMGAGILIAAGLALQWIEVVCARFVGQNAWFFSTLFGEAWNMLNVWLSAAPWHQDLQYWPLLLVATGAAILFSGNKKREPARVEARSGARRDA
jgi:hypothetical protein